MLLKFSTDSEWLAARKNDITSTEVVALFGLSPYKSRLRLWMEKANKIESDFEETPFTTWGRRLQSAIGDGICEDEGWECYDLTGFYLRCPDSRLGASMDFRIVKDGIHGLLEVKTTSFFDEESGWFSDKSPIPYEFQLQAQLHLAIKDGQSISFGVIGALDGRKNVRLYHRIYDPELGSIIDAEAVKFWRSIEQNEPPEPDYAVDAPLIRQMQGDIDLGKNISLTGNNKAHELVERYQDLQQKKSGHISNVTQAQKNMAMIEAELHDLMGTAENAIIGDYRISAREKTVDERLQKEYIYRTFNVSKRKGI